MENVDALLSEHSRLKAEVVMLRELGAGWQERAAAAEAREARLRDGPLDEKALEAAAKAVEEAEGRVYSLSYRGYAEPAIRAYLRAALIDGETPNPRAG